MAIGMDSTPKLARIRLMLQAAKGRTSRLTLLALGLVGSVLMTASCGKTGATFSDPPLGSGGTSGASGARDPEPTGAGRGGSAGAPLGGTSATAGAAAGMSSSGGAGGGGAAAMGGRGGTPAASGAAAGGAVTVEGGASGTDAPVGVDCGTAHCAVGHVCVYCSGARLCVPHPLTQPEAYAKATASCQPAPFGFDECDGPEDCPSDQYCVAHDGNDGRQRCRAMPAPGFCCFTCDALVNCTLCRDDGDCPDAEACSVAFQDIKGCHRK